MNQPLKYSTLRTDSDEATPSTKNPARMRPLPSGHQPPMPKSLRQRMVRRFGLGVNGSSPHAPELRAPTRVLGEDLLVDVGSEPDVVVDEEDGIAGRPLDPMLR